MRRKSNRPETVIVSFPRSGLNWVRYCAEWFSRQRTPGIKRPISKELLTNNKLLFCRTHDVARRGPMESNFAQFYIFEEPVFDKMILLVRNYKEVYVRAARCQMDNMRPYFDDLKAYDEFPPEKLLVYYEDLISDFSYMEQILTFLGVKYDLTNFDLTEHEDRSRLTYSSGRKSLKECKTAKDPLDFTFHSRNISQEERTYLDEYYQEHYPDLFRKYGVRYKEKT